jgi:hypothetical protein
MDKTYLVRRSATTGAVPTAATGTTGELIANTFDGRLWLRGNDGTDTIYEITRPLPSTIAQGGAATGNYLRWNGSAWAAAQIQFSDIYDGGANTNDVLVFDGSAWAPAYLTVSPSQITAGGASAEQVLQWNGDEWVGVAKLTRSVDVQTFTASGTWTKPIGAVSVAIRMSGGGAGGSFGTTSGGGFGGGAGEGISVVLAADYLGATETVTIGSGGTGGVGAGVGGTPAAVNCTLGNPSSFGTTEIKAYAFGGGLGSPVTSGSYMTTKQTNPTGSGSLWGSGGQPVGQAAGVIGFHFSGGGGAGSQALGGAGGAGGATNSFTIVEGFSSRSAGRGGGAAGGATGATGGVGGNGVTNGNQFASGAGGGGSPPNGSTTAMGGNGGVGIRGSGGGGGGRGGTTSAGSNGGAGGNGFAVITTVCYT